MRQLIPLVFLAAMVGVPIILLIVFVQMRAKARREALAGPWSALAQQYGGTMMPGPRVQISRGAYQLSLEMKLVSVMDASGGAYPDGGTFTVARLAFDPAGPVHVAQRAGRVSTQELAGFVPAFAQLPPGTWMTIGPREARIVLPGAVGDAALIGTAFAALAALADHVTASGPVVSP
jgi:hypothetical protein